MAMPRLDYQAPDYSDRISGGLSALGKEAEANSPAPEIVQKYLRMAMSGKMSPQEAARRAQAEHHLSSQPPQAPQQPSQSMPSPGPWHGGAGPASEMEPAANVYAPGTPQGLAAAVPVPNQYGKVQMTAIPNQTGAPAYETLGYLDGGDRPSKVGFTGKREFTGPEETVMGYLPASSASQLEDLPEENLPIRNKDVPTLIQVGGMSNKGQSNDLGYLNYMLGRDRLATNQNQFGAMETHRGIRDEATQATTANIPFKNEMQRQNLSARQFSNQTGRGNLDTRRTENYLRGAGPGLEVSAGLDTLTRQGLASPEIVGASGDYVQRRVAEVAGNLPLLGKFIQSGLTTGADEDLTFAQREFKRRAAAEMSSFVHSRYGSQLTGHELELANRIAGGQLSVADTLAGLQIISDISRRKVEQYQRGYPDVAGEIGESVGGPRIPTAGPYPTGFEGLENIDPPQGVAEPPPPGMRNADPAQGSFGPPPRQLRGKVTSSFGGR